MFQAIWTSRISSDVQVFEMVIVCEPLEIEAADFWLIADRHYRRTQAVFDGLTVIHVIT